MFYTDPNNKLSSDEAVLMLQKHDSKAVYLEFIIIIKALYNNNKLEDAINYAKIFVALNTDYSKAMDALLGSLDAIVIGEKSINSVSNDSELTKLNSALKEAQDYLVKNKIIALRAYMIGATSANEYEIQYLDSSKRAVLRTNNAKFTTKGIFTLNVINQGTIDIKLKDELGGFMQKWDCYIEVTTADIAKIQENEMYVREYTQKINILSTDKAKLEIKMKESKALVDRFFELQTTAKVDPPTVNTNTPNDAFNVQDF